jgi:aquaporin Z
MPSQDAWLFKTMHTTNAKYVAEFVGTYFLVLTVGCNVLTGSVGAALSIGAILMAMIFALGPVSGAHLNPAVTLSVFLSTNSRNDSEKKGEKPMDFSVACMYVLMQLIAGILAGWTYVAICGTSFTLAPIGKFSWFTAASVEVLYTCALCYVVLNVATVKGEENEYFGLAIGFTVTAAALAIGSISGCSLNPAVSVGSAMGTAAHRGLSVGTTHLSMYIWAPLLGGAVSALLFKMVRPDAANA